jgi:hypothetical protein
MTADEHPLAVISIEDSHAVHKDRMRERELSREVKRRIGFGEAKELAPALSTEGLERTGLGS